MLYGVLNVFSYLLLYLTFVKCIKLSSRNSISKYNRHVWLENMINYISADNSTIRRSGRSDNLLSFPSSTDATDDVEGIPLDRGRTTVEKDINPSIKKLFNFIFKRRI